MPYVSFASSFIWVMVIGLLGPSVPAIVSGLGISYAQAGFLLVYHCEYGQGFLYSKPLGVDELAARLAGNTALSA